VQAAPFHLHEQEEDRESDLSLAGHEGFEARDQGVIGESRKLLKASGVVQSDLPTEGCGMQKGVEGDDQTILTPNERVYNTKINKVPVESANPEPPEEHFALRTHGARNRHERRRGNVEALAECNRLDALWEGVRTRDVRLISQNDKRWSFIQT
jgi:hypothetical protein